MFDLYKNKPKLRISANRTLFYNCYIYFKNLYSFFSPENTFKFADFPKLLFEKLKLEPEIKFA